MVQVTLGQLRTDCAATRISVALTIVALIIWAYAITQARFTVGFFGLIDSFPVIYFIALGILTIASLILWLSRENHGRLLLLQLSCLIVAMWLVPVLIGGANPVAPESYYDIGRIDYIVRHGHINPEYIWEHNWPGGWIFWAMFVEVTGMSVKDFAGVVPFTPLLWLLMILLPVFFFLRNTIGRSKPNHVWAGLWLFVLGVWTATLDTGAQAFGVFYVFGMLALLTTSPLWIPGIRSVRQKTTATILLAASTVSHLLGSIVVLCITVALNLTRRVRSPYLVVIAAVFIVAWSAFGAISFFEERLPLFLEAGFRIDIGAEAGITARASGSESHVAVSMAVILLTSLYAAVSALGVLLAVKYKGNRYADITVLAFAASCVFVAGAVGAGYGGVLFHRLWFFLLPAMAYFGVKLLQHRATTPLLCILLLMILPLSFVSRYGNQAIDNLSPSYFASAYFLQDHSTDGYVTGGIPMGRLERQEYYKFFPTLEDLSFESDELAHATGGIGPHYIMITDHDRAYYDHLSDKPGFVDETENSLGLATNCNRVYANPEASMYIRER